MDQLYFEDGYYEGKYFVYTADVLVGFTPYIDAGYLNSDFFEDRGGAFTLVGDITRQAFQQGNAALIANFAVNGTVGRLQLAASTLTVQFTISATVRKTARADSAFASSITVATVSTKTARSSITLTSIANVSAQAARTRLLTSSVSVTASVSATIIKTTQTASTLESQSTFTALEQRFRSTPATLSSAVTQTSNTIITARATLGLNSAFAPVITAVASVSNGSNITANFTVSALIGVRRQFPLNQLTGLGTTSSQYGEIDFNRSLFPPPIGNNASIGTLSARKNYWTFSSWVKRDSITGEFQTIAEGLVTEQTGGATLNNGGIVLKNSDVRIRFNFDPDEPGANWNGVAPTDTEWHHYLFRSVFDQDGQVNTWQLWIDGIYQGTGTSYFAASDLVFAGRFGSNQGVLYGGLRLGYGLIARSQGSYEIVGSPLLGGVAQVWMGLTTDSQFRVERFYSGLLDLGATGTATGLPTPVFYNPLTTPYTGVTLNPGATPDPSPASTPLGLPSVQARFSLVGDSVTVLEITANAESASTLTASISRTRPGLTSLTSTATVNAVGSKTVGVSASVNTTATTSLISQRVRYADSALNSTATVAATAFRVQQTASALNSTATQTATADNRTRSQTATLNSQFTVTARITDRTRDAILLQMGAFTLNLEYEVIRPAGSAMTATFTQTADAQKVVVSTGNFTARFTFGSTVFRVLIGGATLQVNGFTLTQGDILNFDPCREIRVEEETRWARIKPESRLLIVDSETRQLKVPQETRVLKVDFETRVNIIQC